MFCERCGNPVGESERFCSQCGAPLQAAEPVSAESEATAAESEATAAAEPVSAESEATAAESEATAATESVSAESEATAAAESVSAEAEAKIAAGFVQALSVPQVQEAPIAPAIPADKPENESKKPKMKKAPWIIAACTVVFVAVVAICAVNGAKLGNFFRRTFSSPEKYYQYVEKATVSEMAEKGAAYYETMILDSMIMNDRSVNVEMAVGLEERGQELMQMLDMAGVDLTWLTDLSMGIGYSLKDSLLGYDIFFGMNDSDILSVNTITDLDNGIVYLQIPELTSNYMGFEPDMGEYSRFDIDQFSALQKMQEAMPEAKKVEKLLQKYLLLALSGVRDVDKSTKILEVEGIKQKCTELEVTIDGKSLSKMLETVLKELPKDKEFKKLFVSMADGLMELYPDGSFFEDGEDLYDEFIEGDGGIQEVLDHLDELEDLGDVLVMKVYVDSRGKIVGRVLELMEDDGELYATVSLLTPEKGSWIGCEFSVQPEYAYGESITLTGKGRKSGDKVAGDFQLEYEGMPVFDLSVYNLDMEQLKRGYLNGSVTITFSKQIDRLLSSSLSYYGSAYASMLTDIQLTIDSQMSENSGTFVLLIGYGKENLASISMSIRREKGSRMRVPDAKDTILVEDEDDLVDWLKEVDWESFIERLNKANMPDEVTESVEELVDLLDEYGYYGPLFGYGDWDHRDDLFDDYFDPDWFDNDYDNDHSNDYNDDFGSDYYYDDYDDDLMAYGSLEQLLRSDDWQEELEDWNSQVGDTGIITTEADGNTLVFSWHLPDDDIYGSFTGDECAQVAEIFLDVLESSDYLSLFETGYGISLDGVRVVFLKSDGTEIYRGELN